MNSIYLFGALRVIVEDRSGAILGVFDCITNQEASGNFSPDYISRAVTMARLAWQSTADH